MVQIFLGAGVRGAVEVNGLFSGTAGFHQEWGASRVAEVRALEVHARGRGGARWTLGSRHRAISVGLSPRACTDRRGRGALLADLRLPHTFDSAPPVARLCIHLPADTRFYRLILVAGTLS